MAREAAYVCSMPPPCVYPGWIDREDRGAPKSLGQNIDLCAEKGSSALRMQGVHVLVEYPAASVEYVERILAVVTQVDE